MSLTSRPKKTQLYFRYCIDCGKRFKPSCRTNRCDEHRKKHRIEARKAAMLRYKKRLKGGAKKCAIHSN